METSPIEELFAKALDGEYDDDEPWSAVHALHGMRDRAVFDRAAAWCASGDPLKRARGADVLAQIGKSADQNTNAFPEESYEAVVRMLEREKDPRPLSSGLFALGHLDQPAGLPLVLDHVTHANERVRFAAAFALGCFEKEPGATHALLTLMTDPSNDVRDWATFAVGVLGSADTPEIREALFARTADPDIDTREEAMVGLAKRKDPRVVGPLLAELAQLELTSRSDEAARLLLGLEHADEEWTAAELIEAIRVRFGGREFK
ncbi:MAG: HEAT repeat domain-containing protein [Bryobacteraceae bacterium]